MRELKVRHDQADEHLRPPIRLRERLARSRFSPEKKSGRSQYARIITNQVVGHLGLATVLASSFGLRL